MAEATREKRSLFTLLSQLPTQVRDLVAAEIAQLKAEMIGKLKGLGIGAGLMAAAAVVVLFAVGVLLTAAVLALALVMPGWLAALLVAVLLLVIAALIGLAGYRKFKTGLPPVPTESIDSIKRDINMVRGLGK